MDLPAHTQSEEKRALAGARRRRQLMQLAADYAARIIGVSVPTVRALVERGELAGWRIGRSYRFSKQAVDEFLTRSARPYAA